jgi:hypothetical protein
MTSTTNDPGLSRWFGILAILSIATGWALDVAVPYLLTDGTFGAPIIRTKVHQDCLNVTETSAVSSWAHWTIAFPKIDGIFQGCQIPKNLDQTCFSDYYFLPPKIEKKRVHYCPFMDKVCQSQVKPFEITHWNVSAEEIGINSPARISFSHRLTCAPAVAEEFQISSLKDPRDSRGPQFSWITSRTPENTSVMERVNATWAVQLESLNGPNSISSSRSGGPLLKI